jgi:very-short-patch-repair endonuclease
MSGHLYNDPARKSERRRLRKNSTDAEVRLWSIVRDRRMGGLKFFRQYSVGPYVLDFYCTECRLAVEVDGGQHADSHSEQHDAERDIYLSDLGIRVIRFWNSDVLQNIEGVAGRIREEVEKES